MQALTPKQMQFARYVAEGLTGSEAYRRVYATGRSARDTHWTNASRLKANPKVSALIKELQAENAALSGLSRAEKRRILANIARDPDADVDQRIQAVKADNLMTGDNKPIKVEGEITLGSILREISGSRGLPAEDRKP